MPNHRVSPHPTEPCTGRSKRTGLPCKLSAGFGTEHLGYGPCRFHGGSSPSGIKNGQKLMAAELVAMYGLSREIDPHSALIEELYRTAGHVAWLQDRIQRAEQSSDLTQSVGGGESSHPEIKPSVWVSMYTAERGHFAKIAKTCIDVGIAERQVRLAEDQGRLVAKVLQGVLRDLGVADLPETPEVVRRHLTAISGSLAA